MLTFSEQGLFWTNNPAWIIYDLITDKTFGAGKYGVNPESVDKWSFYKFAQRCDELVDVATGNTTEKEKRHTCNLYIDTEQNAYELTNQLLDNYNADLHWSAGEIFITQDAPSTEVMMFNNSNISEEGFSYSNASQSTKATVVNGHVTAIELVNSGSNYTFTPRIVFKDPGGGVLSQPTLDANNGVDPASITVTSGGVGYTVPPTVYVDAPTGTDPVQAEITAEITNGSLSGFSVVNRGRGYTSAPRIAIIDPGAAQILDVTVDSTGRVIDIEPVSYTHLTLPTNREV